MINVVVVVAVAVAVVFDFGFAFAVPGTLDVVEFNPVRGDPIADDKPDVVCCALEAMAW